MSEIWYSGLFSQSWMKGDEHGARGQTQCEIITVLSD